MSANQWIQIIASGALVFVTGVLAVLTFKYMKATKHMADIMQKEYDLLIKPDIAPLFHMSVPIDGGIRYQYIVSNISRRSSSLLKRIKIMFWHKDTPETRTSMSISEPNINIPSSGSTDIDIPISFSSITEEMEGNVRWEDVFMQPVFIIEDKEGQEHEFPAISRLIGK